MSGTIRSRMEAQRDRHKEYHEPDTTIWPYAEWSCSCGYRGKDCPDRVAADDTLTDLNNAEKLSDYPGYRLIPDPDSRGAT